MRCREKEPFAVELDKLRNLYEKGLFKSEFYSAKVDRIEAFRDYESFCNIPFTYKDELRVTSAMERSTTKLEDVYGVFSSSGTTGKKTYYIYSKKDKAVHECFVREYLGKLGVCEKDIGGIMAPIDTGVMAHTMMWEFTTMGAGYVNCPEPSPSNMAELIRTVPVSVVATRPNIASAPMYTPDLVSEFRTSHVRMLILGGGFMSRSRRELIESIWNAECFNLFGMSEMFGPIAAECRQRYGLHFFDDYLMIELVDPDTSEPVQPGKPGVAVYTTLWEKGFPLLRYWTDDYIAIDQTECPCGSKLPRIRHLGRLGDCYKRDGHMVFAEPVEEVLFSHGLLGEYRILDFGDTVKVQTELFGEQSDAGEALAELKCLFDLKSLTLEIVDQNTIERSANGKRFIYAG